MGITAAASRSPGERRSCSPAHAVAHGHHLDAHQTDVAPTIAALLGLPIPAPSEGQVLFDALDLSPATAAALRAANVAPAPALRERVRGGARDRSAGARRLTGGHAPARRLDRGPRARARAWCPRCGRSACCWWRSRLLGGATRITEAASGNRHRARGVERRDRWSRRGGGDARGDRDRGSAPWPRWHRSRDAGRSLAGGRRRRRDRGASWCGSCNHRYHRDEDDTTSTTRSRPRRADVPDRDHDRGRVAATFAAVALVAGHAMGRDRHPRRDRLGARRFGRDSGGDGRRLVAAPSTARGLASSALVVAAAIAGVAAISIVDSPARSLGPHRVVAPLALSGLGAWLGPARRRGRLALVGFGVIAVTRQARR